MNRTNRGYEFANFDLPSLEIADAIDPIPAGMGDAQQQTARIFDDLAKIAGEKADKDAQRVGRIAGLEAGQNGNIRPIDTTTITGAAYTQGAQEGLSASIEVNLRQGLNEVALAHPRDPDAYKQAAAEKTNEVVGSLNQVIAKDPENPAWRQLLINANQLASQTIDSEYINRRRQIEAENIRATQADMAGRADERFSVAQRAARDAVTNPNETTAGAAIAATNSLNEALISLGPKEAFELNGVQYPADNSRAGLKNPAELRKTMRDAQTSLFETSQMAMQEKAGNGEAQRQFAAAFDEKWKSRPQELSFLEDDQAQEVSQKLWQQAAIIQGREQFEENQKRQDLSELTNLVQRGGRLSAQQIEQGNVLIGAIGDVGLSQEWDNAKELSRTGRRLLDGAQLGSIYGGAIPLRAYAGGAYNWASSGGGGGRRGRFHVGHPPEGASDGEIAAWNTMRPAAISEPLQFASRQRMAVPRLNANGLIANNPEQNRLAIGQLRERLAFGTRLANEIGAPQRIFTNREVAVFNRIIAANPNAGVEIASRINQSLGENAGVALSELRIGGVAGVAANVVAGGANPQYAQGIIAGRQGTKASLTAAQNRDIQATARRFAQMSGSVPVVNEQMPSLITAVQNAMLNNIAHGRPAGSPASHFQALFNSVNVNGVNYGGVGNINGGNVWLPNWMRRDRAEDFMNFAAPAIARHVITASGRTLTANQIARMRLMPLGDGKYHVVTGADAQGRPQVLRGRESGGAYVLDIERFRPILRAQRPGWVR